MGRVDLSGIFLLAFLAFGSIVGVLISGLVLLAASILSWTVSGFWVLFIIVTCLLLSFVYWLFLR